MAGNQSFYIDTTLESKLLLLKSSVADFTPLKLQAQTSTSIVRLMMQNSDASRFMSLIWDSAGGAEVLNITGDSQTPAQFFRTGDVTLTSTLTNQLRVKSKFLVLNSAGSAGAFSEVNTGTGDGGVVISGENGSGGLAAQLWLYGPTSGAPSDIRFRQNGVDTIIFYGSVTPRRMVLGQPGDTNQHTIYGSFDTLNPQSGTVQWSFRKDVNAGDSTNIAQIALGNSGSNQGHLRVGYTNAAAAGSPSAQFAFDPRNNADTTNINAGRLLFQKVAGNNGAQALIQTSTTSGTLTTAISINEAQLVTLGAPGTDVAHSINGGLELITATKGIAVNDTNTTTNIMVIKRNQDATTRFLFVNNDNGVSSQARLSIAAGAGDINIFGTSVAGGATNRIEADATFTGGMIISQLGNNSMVLRTNSTDALTIQGNQTVIVASSLRVGTGGFGAFGAVSGAHQAFSSSLSTGTSTTNSIVGVGAFVNDGINNKRISLFADHLNQSVGIVYSASSGGPAFYISNAFTGKVPLSFSATDLVTIGGTGVTQTHLIRSRGLATTDAPSGSSTGFSAVHDSDTAGSSAAFAAQVAGSSAGDPVMAFVVAGQNAFAMGMDNDDSDQFKISLGTTLGTTDYLKLNTSGQFTFGASGNSNQHTINGPVRISNVSGPILELLDGGTFGTNADPYISFRDSSVEGGRVGFTSAATNTLQLRNIISGGGLSLSTNNQEQLFLSDSTTGHDASYGVINQTMRYKGSLFIGRSATEYPYVGFNARSKSGANTYDYDSADTASIIRFDDGGFRFRGTATIGTIGGAITFVDNMFLNKNGVLMIGTTTAAASTPYVDFVRGTAGTASGIGHIRLSDITTDATGKQTAISWRHTTNAEEDHAIFYASGADLYLGGGLSALNAVSTLRFYTGATSTTTTGSEAMRISSGQDVYIGTTSNQGGHTIEKLNVYNITGATAPGTNSYANISSFLDMNTMNAMTSGTNSSTMYISMRRNLSSQVANVTDTGASGLSTIFAEARISTAPTFSYINTSTPGVAVLRIAGPVLAGGGTTSITNYNGIRIDSNSAATGTNKYGLFIDDHSGATNNWSIWTTTVGSVRFGNTLRIGDISGVLSLDNEQISVRRLLQSGDLSLGNIAGQFEYNNTNDAAVTSSATQASLGAIYRRTITTSITDSATASYFGLGANFVYTVSSGQTYTNTSEIYAAILAGSPSLSGGGSLAITHYSGLLVSSSSINTGTNKYGIRINDQTGATNNFSNIYWLS